MKLKVFYKGYFRQNKGCFIEILTKIKSKLTSFFFSIFITGSLSLNPCYDIRRGERGAANPLPINI